LLIKEVSRGPHFMHLRCLRDVGEFWSDQSLSSRELRGRRSRAKLFSVMSMAVSPGLEV
jgi:hypothetical protein